jgi:hypothetical protein
VTAVIIATLGAEGSDLHHTVGVDNPYGAVLYACQNQPMVMENSLNLLRCSGGA